jgi:cyclopropane-fatty-acyl-phospholipid synthase
VATSPAVETAAPLSPGAAALIDMLTRAVVNCEVVVPGGRSRRIGTGTPKFVVTVHREEGLRPPLNELQLGTAYINGDIDVDGDFRAMLAIREVIKFGTAAKQLARFAYELFIRSPVAVNRNAIDDHYTLGDDFYLTFIDSAYRFYSHCIFRSEDETLEQAAVHKLESMWQALDLQPGMRLLDIGGGWGGVAEYCSPRGVHVTSLTLVEDSYNYIRALIEERGLDADVRRGDILTFEADEPFDHAVIYGVIEHIPNYARFCDRVWRALKPGGRLYLDASAAKEKFAISPITRKYTWPGHHSFLALQEIIRELLYHGFEIVEVKRETRDYELTISAWAERFEAAREDIVARWGEPIYRAFRIFLWGGAHAFETNRLQAYHVVAERRPDPGPRPGLARRVAGFVTSLQ